jgi:hypothetical protein
MTTNTYFKIAANDKRITSVDMAALCLAKAASSVQEDKVALAGILLKQAFSPITLPNKLHNGASPYQALNEALTGVRITLTRFTRAFGFTEEEGALVLDLATKVGRF